MTLFNVELSVVPSLLHVRELVKKLFERCRIKINEAGLVEAVVLYLPCNSMISCRGNACFISVNIESPCVHIQYVQSEVHLNGLKGVSMYHSQCISVWNLEETINSSQTMANKEGSQPRPNNRSYIGGKKRKKQCSRCTLWRRNLPLSDSSPAGFGVCGINCFCGFAFKSIPPFGAAGSDTHSSITVTTEYPDFAS